MVQFEKALLIICVIHIIVLVVAVIVIPIYVFRFVMSQTTTTSSPTNWSYNASQCSNYTLDTDATRLTTYSVSASGCDTTIFATPTWIRFGGPATQMASSPPAIYRCATYATGWYTGTYPSTAGTSVSGVVCYSWTTTICDFRSIITVTNCGSFYVYLLVAPPQCNLRYCSQ